jgi:hypothetical protein
MRFCHLTWSDLTERKHAGAIGRVDRLVDGADRRAEARIAYLEAKLWPAPEDAREVERSAVRILRAVVERATDLLAVGDAKSLSLTRDKSKARQ